MAQQVAVRPSTAPDAPGALPRRSVLLRTLALTLLGVLLVQAAWVLAVPPFRGSDEHDHAYKAAAVARGDWSWDHEVSPMGWGAFVRAPADCSVPA